MEYANSTRFGMFAAAHILWSLVCAWPVMRLLGKLELWLPTACAAGMMLAYLPLGWVIARFGRWPLPHGSQHRWAVLLPAGIAWVWAGCTALFLYIDHDVAIAAALGLPAFLLASPSLLFIECFMQCIGRLLESGDMMAWLAAAIFFAGLLPPLLFHLGACLGSRKGLALEDDLT